MNDRLTYEADRNILFANFEGMAIRSIEDIESIRRVFDALCIQVGHKLSVIVNYDGFQLDESISDTSSPWWPSSRRNTTPPSRVIRPVHS